MDSEKKIIGRCPFCGGNVVKTCKGYRWKNRGMLLQHLVRTR